MKTKDSTVCVIPARGGSKRIPKKNLLLLSGKPLIVYTIEAVLGSDCFAEVYVSSDENEILDIAREYGAIPDLRPQDLAGDSIKVAEVVYEFMKRSDHHGKWDNVAMCLPTCPFRTAEDIKNAMNLFLHNREHYHKLISVTRCDFPPQLVLKKIAGTSLLDMREPNSYSFSTRSQDFEEFYFPNGSIYLSTVDEFLKSRSFFGRHLNSYVMPAERCLDIDHPYQVKMAEVLMQETSKEKGRS